MTLRSVTRNHMLISSALRFSQADCPFRFFKKKTHLLQWLPLGTGITCVLFPDFRRKDGRKSFRSFPIYQYMYSMSIASHTDAKLTSCRLRVVSLLSWRFLTKPDCILSSIQLVKLSFGTDKRAVSEGISYPIITDLDILPADYPIFIIITREVQLTLVPTIRFQIVVVNEALREFPSL